MITTIGKFSPSRKKFCNKITSPFLVDDSKFSLLCRHTILRRKNLDSSFAREYRVSTMFSAIECTLSLLLDMLLVLYLSTYSINLFLYPLLGLYLFVLQWEIFSKSEKDTMCIPPKMYICPELPPRIRIVYLSITFWFDVMCGYRM